MSGPDIEAVLTHYGADQIPGARGTGWRSMRCPFHDDSHSSASVNSEAFYCHACGVKGDGLSIIQQQESCTFPEALKIAETIDTSYNPNEKRSSRRSGKRSTGRRWTPPGRRGRQTWA